MHLSFQSILIVDWPEIIIFFELLPEWAIKQVTFIFEFTTMLS